MTPVHYPSGTDQCRGALIMRDEPPGYQVVDVIAAQVNAQGVVTWVGHQDVPREPAPAIPPTQGQWHYPGECPYGLNVTTAPL